MGVGADMFRLVLLERVSAFGLENRLAENARDLRSGITDQGIRNQDSGIRIFRFQDFFRS